MSDIIKGDPAALAAYTKTTQAAFGDVDPDNGDYSGKFAAFFQQPNDVAWPNISNRATSIYATAHNLKSFDEIGQALALAFERLNQDTGNYPGMSQFRYHPSWTTDGEAFNAIVKERMADPNASDDLVVKRATADVAHQDAARLHTAIDHAYGGDWSDVMRDPDKLDALAKAYPGLKDALSYLTQHQDLDGYAATVYNSLGGDETKKLLDVTNRYGDPTVLHDVDGANPLADILLPLSSSLSAADKSGQLDPTVRSAIFDLDGKLPDDLSDKERYISDLTSRRRTLSLLLYYGDFTPQFTADGADAVLRGGEHSSDDQYEGYTYLAHDTPALVDSEFTALTALSRDSEACYRFLSIDKDGNGRPDNPGIMLVAGNYPRWFERRAADLGLDYDALSKQFVSTAAQILKDGALTYPLATGKLNDPTQVKIVDELLFQTSFCSDDVGHLDPQIAQSLALVTSPYTKDLAISADGGDDWQDPSRLHVSQDQIDKFFAELGRDPTARQTLALNGAALTKVLIGGAAPDLIDNTSYPLGEEKRLIAAYYRELGEGDNAANVSKEQARKEQLAAFESVTGPVLDLVSGKIIKKIPVVSTAADLPLAKNVVDGVTGEIKNDITHALESKLYPEPKDLQDMQKYRDGLRTQMEDTVGRTLYDDPRYKAAVKQAHPDWDGSYQQFQTFHDVRDKVLGISDSIVTQVEADMSYDAAYH